LGLAQHSVGRGLAEANCCPSLGKHRPHGSAELGVGVGEESSKIVKDSSNFK
jgi:hypothetical protein